MVDLCSQIKQNLEIIQERIDKAAKISGRQSKDICLVVVSKAQPVEVIQAAYTSGVRRFGENYPQEAEKKIGELGHLADSEWHMIGHLQSRKIPIIVNQFQYIHSIDRLSLAEKLNRALMEQNKILPAFLEVNISGEVSKSGWSAADPDRWAQLLSEFSDILRLSNLKILGLMTMPPYFEDPETGRPYFRKLRKLRDFLVSKIPDGNWNELSMGTSGDYEVAVEEGATFVRIGQAILGPRPVG
jgi:pyridoxal phosphate enzyme (YggS family)